MSARTVDVLTDSTPMFRHEAQNLAFAATHIAPGAESAWEPQLPIFVASRRSSGEAITFYWQLCPGSCIAQLSNPCLFGVSAVGSRLNSIPA